MAAERGVRRRAGDADVTMAAAAETRVTAAPSDQSWTLPTEFGGSGSPAAPPSAPSASASSGGSGHEHVPGGAGGAGGPGPPDDGSGGGHFRAGVAAGPAPGRWEHSGCDPKLLEKPSRFSGEISAWRGWRDDVVAYFGAVDSRFERALDEAAREPRRIQWTMVPPFLVTLGRFLFAFVLGLVGGILHEVVSNVEEHNGWEAWRCIHREMEPREGAGRLVALERRLEPDLASTASGCLGSARFGIQVSSFGRRCPQT